MTPAGLLLQALTTLSLAPPGPGLPGGWTLERSDGEDVPVFAVTRAHTLRVAAAGAAGVASYRLHTPLRPQAGTISWQWRTATPLRDADGRRPGRDDAPAQVVLVFADGRSVVYSWGDEESRGERLRTPRGARRGVIVLERAEDADGSWHLERRDPFADYQLVFGRAPGALVAVGAGADTAHLRGRAVAEVGELTWDAGGAP